MPTGLNLDLVIRWIVGGHAVTKQAASTSQMGRVETEVLVIEENFAALAELSGQWIDRVHDRCPPKKIVLEPDSSVNPTHGDPEAWRDDSTHPTRKRILFPVLVGICVDRYPIR